MLVSMSVHFIFHILYRIKKIELELYLICSNQSFVTGQVDVLYHANSCVNSIHMISYIDR